MTARPPHLIVPAITFLIGLALGSLTVAPSASAAADASFRAFVNEIWREAAKLGVRKETFDGAFAGIEPILSLPELAPPNKAGGKGQAEFLKPAGDYLKESRLAGLAKVGAAKAAAHQPDLAAIEERLGVDGAVLLAIWGRESDFSRQPPTHSVIGVLATQAYMGRRKDYFRRELLEALQILEEGDITAKEMRGSWAGAMGLTQFMPSGFRKNAVDFDGDGRRNIWTSVPDSLASSAQELKAARDRDRGDVSWQKGKSWGYEVRKPADIDCTLQGYDRPKTIREWAELGYTRAYDRTWTKAQLDDPAFLLLPEGTDGPAFLVLRNFLSLKAYNYADLYALFVGHLSDRIAGGKPFETRWAKSSHLTEPAIFELQGNLIGLGYDVGKHDGKIGWRMRQSLGAFEKKAGLKLDCYPSDDDMAAAARAAQAN